MNRTSFRRLWGWASALTLWVALLPGFAQTLLNVDFGAAQSGAKVGPAAVGQGTNDFWNRYNPYTPRYLPGMPWVSNGVVKALQLSDGSASAVAIAVSNAPGVWGNTSGDAMWDTYLFAPDGGEMTVLVSGLRPGRYHFYLYGHADADVAAEQNSLFTLRSGTNVWGPVGAAGGGGWKVGMPWQERAQYVALRDVWVEADEPVTLTVGPGPGGMAVLNGLQILSRGTSPSDFGAGRPSGLPDAGENLLLEEVRYTGRVHEDGARLRVELAAQALVAQEMAIPLFAGALAVSATNLPPGWRLAQTDRGCLLVSSGVGRHRFTVDLEAQAKVGETWREVGFRGPAAAVATIEIEAAEADTQIELTAGLPWAGGAEPAPKGARVRGVVGPDRAVGLRWRSKTVETQRRSFVTAETTGQARCTPVVVQYETRVQYEILQAPVGRLTFVVPGAQALTRLEGEGIRDWRLASAEGRNLLTVDLLKPVEKSYSLLLRTEQPVESGAVAPLALAQPLEVDRESGLLVVSTGEAQIEFTPPRGLLQANPPAGALAAFRFNARPFELGARIRPTEAEIEARSVVGVRVEDNRLVVEHRLDLQVSKAGIYVVSLRPQAGFEATRVQGEGVEDWRLTNGVVTVSFARKLLGRRQLEVRLERPWSAFPAAVSVESLRVDKAKKETCQVGVSAGPGIRLKTGESAGLREVPVSRLASPTAETLAFVAEQPDWRLGLLTESPPARLVAEVFNLVAVGDGMLGGSATVRLSILNQGLQQFRVRVPSAWKNLEFTGPGIRRKEATNDVWTITLQEKAWGGYTLVVTYDLAFDPKGARLNLGGAHPLEVEREKGTLAITAAPGLELRTTAVSPALRRIDEAELAEADRGLITRAVLLAYRYSGDAFDLGLEATRFEQTRLIDAVADRTELTTVLTEEGQTLTQASFLVKNNDKQFQRFRLPAGADFWSCLVNRQPVKTEKDGDWLLVPLPRQLQRSEASAVDLVYAQKIEALPRARGRRVTLEAPRTDVPNSYVEWQWYAPSGRRLSDFGGTLKIARGTAYGWREAWRQTWACYAEIVRQLSAGWLVGGGLVLGWVLVAVVAARRRWRALFQAWVAGGFLVFLLAALLPRLVMSRSAGLPPGERFAGEVDLDARSAFTDEAAVQTPVLSPSVVIQTNASPTALNQPMAPQMMRRYGLAPAATRAPQAEPRLLGQAGYVAAASPEPADSAESGAPVTAGIRPLQIEVPKEGRPYHFSKVMNLDDAALTVEARVSGVAGGLTWSLWFEAIVFLLGLYCLRRGAGPNRAGTFRNSVGAFLTLAAVAHALWEREALHWGLAALPPLLAVTLLGQLLWRFLPARRKVATTAAAAVAIWLGGGGPIAGAATPEASLAADAIRSLAPTKAPARELPATPPRITLPSARLSGELREGTARLELALRVSAFATNQSLRLLGNDVGLEDFTPVPQARLARTAAGLTVHLEQPGDYDLRLRLLVQTTAEGASRRLCFAPPPALRCDFDLLLDEAEAEVVFPGAIRWRRTPTDRGTRVEAVLGGGGPVDLRWTPRVKRAAEIAATVFCEHRALIQVEPNGVQTRSVLEYQVSQGELRQSRLWLPPRQRLLRVGGEAIRTWDLRPAATNAALPPGGQELVVDYVKGMAPRFELSLATEEALAALPATVAVLLPRSLEAKRESGCVGVRAGEDLAVTIESGDLPRMDTAEFARAGGEKTDSLEGAYRFMKPGFDLKLHVEAARPRVEAVAHHRFAIGLAETRLESLIQYQIKRLGVFSFRVAVPREWRVERVAGTNILQWTQNEGAVEVALTERATGAYTLALALTRAYKETPAELTLAGVTPLGTAKDSGFVTLAPRLGIALKTRRFEGLTELAPAAVEPAPAAPEGLDANPASAAGAEPAAAVALAFRLNPKASAPAGGWTLGVALEKVTPWIRAEVATTIQLGETLIGGRTWVRFEAANAPVKEFRVRVPAAYTNVEFSGADIRQRDRQTNDWRIELQNPVSGYYQLALTWELPRVATNPIVDFTGVEAPGAERESGYLAVLAQPPLQVGERTATELLRVEARDWPQWAGAPRDTAVLTYRYLRPGYRLQLAAQRFNEAAVLQALVDRAQLDTVVAEDGQAMTEMRLWVRNNGRQFLQMELPAGTRVWSALVAGQPVRPCWRQGQLLLPLDRPTSGNEPVEVEVLCVGTNAFPRSAGDWRMASPKLDVPWKNVTWRVYLPSDYRYSDFRGTMRAVAPHAREVLYTRADYETRETRRNRRLDTEAQANLAQLQANLGFGNLKEAVGNYTVARGKLSLSQREGGDRLQQMERDLGQMQGSNLLRAQNSFLLSNGGVDANPLFDARGRVPANQIDLNANPRAAFNWDADAAARQARVVAQVQEIAVANLRPLRASLPTRGVLLTFSQALQTETQKPLTIELSAVNTEAGGWKLGLAFALGSFIALWLILRLRTRPVAA